MESVYLLGTNIPDFQKSNHAFSVIHPLIEAAGGLSLSQIKEITGLEGSTIQNWVKRGWIPKPQGKRYHDLQLARILLIGALRPAIQIDQLVRLIDGAFLPGRLGSSPDRTEVALFDLLSQIVRRLEEDGMVSLMQVEQVCEQAAAQSERGPEEQRRLSQTLSTMALAYFSSQLQRQASQQLAQILF